MKLMNKVFSSTLALGALLAPGFYSQKADAYAIVGIMGYGYVPSLTDDHAVDVALCVVLLPFCLLDEKAEAGQISQQDLLDNGYSSEQVSSILSGQEAVMSYLTANGLRLSGSGSSQELAAVLSQVPGVTQGYLDFVRSN